MAHFEARSSLMQKVKEAQKSDPYIQTILNEVKECKMKYFSINQEGVLRYGERLCVLKINELKREILEEAHKSSYSIHLGAIKMYQDLKQLY